VCAREGHASAWSTSRNKLYMRAGKTEPLLMVFFHELLSFRHLYTIRLSHGEGIY
jgi:hypothetical protein